MSKATPGPWTHEVDYTAHQRLQPCVRARVYADHAEDGYKLVAECLNSSADAILIAAAPELRDALRELLQIADEVAAGVTPIALYPARTRARAALAKAGE